jgi:hypothetical protein
MEDFKSFYSSPGKVTDPGACTHLLDGLPDDIGELCRVVQGLLVHRDWASHMNVVLDEKRVQEIKLRVVERQLARILELDDRPLTVKRPKEKCLVGTCRDFSTLMVGILRHKGIAARARCGFGGYFTPGKWEDHWVCEYWRADQNRWVMLDAQLDAFQRSVLKPDFDTLDMPPGRFLTGGQAWQKCRRGEADPEAFGIFDMHGTWFIAGNVLRDFLSLNKVELLPWDVWAVWPAFRPDPPLSREVLSWLDGVAEMTLGGNDGFPGLRAVFLADGRFREPAGWPVGTFGPGGVST